jgi:hypothetical protein
LPIAERVSNADHVKICFTTLGILSAWRNSLLSKNRSNQKRTDTKAFVSVRV